MSPPESFLELLRQIDELVALFEAHPDPSVREPAGALLSGIDALHREGLARLVRRVREAGGGELLERAAADPVVAVLLGLYDLRPLEVVASPARAGRLVQLRVPSRKGRAR